MRATQKKRHATAFVAALMALGSLQACGGLGAHGRIAPNIESGFQSEGALGLSIAVSENYVAANVLHATAGAPAAAEIFESTDPFLQLNNWVLEDIE